MIAVKRRGERTVECTSTKASTIVDSETVVVSIDGKTLTFYARATGPKGERVYYQEVRDRK